MSAPTTIQLSVDQADALRRVLDLLVPLQLKLAQPHAARDVADLAASLTELLRDRWRHLDDVLHELRRPVKREDALRAPAAAELANDILRFEADSEPEDPNGEWDIEVLGTTWQHWLKLARTAAGREAA